MTTVEIYPNRAAIGRCLDTYLDGMCPFVVRHLKQMSGTTVVESIRNSIGGGGYAAYSRIDDFNRNLEEAGGKVEVALDVGTVRTVVDRQWHAVFRDAFSRDDTVRSAIHCITETRNRATAHRGAADIEFTVALAFMEHIITVLRCLNYPHLERVFQEKYAVLERCLAAYQQENQSPNFQENISRAAELEAAAAQADERSQQANTALALLQGVMGIERVTAERVAAVAAHEAAVAAHEAAVAEHEAAVAEHEAAMIALKEATDRLETARSDRESSEAGLAIRQAEKRLKAALERETAADDKEAEAERHEAEANLHDAIAEDYMLALSAAEEVVVDALRQAAAHGAELAEVVQQVEERKEAAKNALDRAVEREKAADRREDLADDRETSADERASDSRKLEGEPQERRTSSEPHPLPEDWPRLWRSVAAQLRLEQGKAHNLSALLRGCTVDSIRDSGAGSQLLLLPKHSTAERWLMDELSHPEVREKVEAAIAQVFGRRYSVEVIRL